MTLTGANGTGTRHGTRGHRRTGLAVLVACALALAWTPAVDPASGDEIDAEAPDDAEAGGDVTAQGGDGTSLLVTVESRDEVPAAANAAASVADEVEELAPRVLGVSGDHDEVRRALRDHPVTIERDGLLRAASPPDDPRFPDQWGMQNDGQTVAGQAGTSGVDVGALRAWEHTRGARDVTIAVVDTRIPDHEDLAGNLMRGSGDRFVSSTDCRRRVGVHGLEVAGVAAAVADNGIGIAGLAPRTRIMPVPFLDNCGNGFVENAVAAISWAADNGADVIVASFGSSGTATPVASLRAAIENAGVPVIAAAGNSEPRGRNLSAGGTAPVYPASYDLRNLLSVAASDNQGQLASFSNYGIDDVELAAPGKGVATTTIGPNGWHVVELRDGTSFAAPYVAAAVALASSLRPVQTPEAILDLTEDTARGLEGLDGTVATGGMLDAGELVHTLTREGGCPTSRVPGSGFRDVGGESVHALSVDCIAWWGITRGRTATTYEPRSSVTRGQMATFLGSVIDAGPGLPSNPPSAFPDVGGSVHEDPVNGLAALGIVRGHRDGTYRPSAPVTRDQMATFVVNTYEHLVGRAPSPDQRWFEDTAGSVHAAAADSLWELGISGGTDARSYAPRRDVRRDQMASFVARLLDLAVRGEVVPPR